MKNNLSWVGNEVATGFLILDGTENAEEVNQHHTVSKLGPIIEAVARRSHNRSQGYQQMEEYNRDPC